MRTGKIRNVLTGAVIDVFASCDHPDSSYGRAVWVDGEGVAYLECDSKVPNPFYENVSVRTPVFRRGKKANGMKFGYS